MRVAVYGASGRVGTTLLEAMLSTPGLELAAAHVSPGSEWIGRQVGNTVIEYRPAEATINSHCDAIIDFSTPDASIALQRLLDQRNVPVVLGTTAFTTEQKQSIEAFARYRPIMVGANFALGFGAFARAATACASAHPAALVTIEETYHQRKKRAASGTTLLLAAMIRNAQGGDGASAPPEPEVRIHRIGNAVGTTEIIFDLGVSETRLRFAVQTIAAYAQGALAAATWLVSEAPHPGLYDPFDMPA